VLKAIGGRIGFVARAKDIALHLGLGHRFGRDSFVLICDASGERECDKRFQVCVTERLSFSATPDSFASMTSSIWPFSHHSGQ
jgi:hypothetical protein